MRIRIVLGGVTLLLLSMPLLTWSQSADPEKDYITLSTTERHQSIIGTEYVVYNNSGQPLSPMSGKGNKYVTKGKWYWEVIALNPGSPVAGICTAESSLSQFPGDEVYSWGYDGRAGQGRTNGSVLKTFPTIMTTSYTSWNYAHLMIALDLDSGKMWFGANGSWFGSGNPASGTNPAVTGLQGKRVTPCYGMMFGTSMNLEFRTGAEAKPFKYRPPTDFRAITQANIQRSASGSAPSNSPAALGNVQAVAPTPSTTSSAGGTVTLSCISPKVLRPGNYSIVVPAYTSFTVELWGGGGGGGGGGLVPGNTTGLDGDSSIFNSLIANGGKGGGGSDAPRSGIGGSATGGDTNLTGPTGQPAKPGGLGGGAAGKEEIVTDIDAALAGDTNSTYFAGTGGSGGYISIGNAVGVPNTGLYSEYFQYLHGTSLMATNAGGGGGGGYTKKTYGAGSFSVGSTISAVVGAGGKGGAGGHQVQVLSYGTAWWTTPGSTGFAGAIRITCTRASGTSATLDTTVTSGTSGTSGTTATTPASSGSTNLTPRMAVGNRIQTTDNIWIKPAPALSDSFLGVAPWTEFGTIIDGPAFGDGLLWWKVEYDIDLTGWGRQDMMQKTGEVARSCALNEFTIPSGTLRTFYLFPKPGQDVSCADIVGTRKCIDGVLGSPSTYIYSSCTDSSGLHSSAVAPRISQNHLASFSERQPTSSGGSGIACSWKGQTIADRDYIIAHLSDTTLPGVACVAERRYCYDGVLAGTYEYKSCTAVSAYSVPKFSISDRVRLVGIGNMRSLPSYEGAILSVQPYGSIGTITDGPKDSNIGLWWKVQYDSGALGWNPQDAMRKTDTAQQMQSSIAVQTTSTPTPAPTPTPSPTSTPPTPPSCVALSANVGADDTDATTNGDVSLLQKFLMSQSLLDSSLPRGYFGPATQKAVQAWQSKNGVISSGTPDTTGYGYVGPKTRTAMAQGCGSTASTVPNVQDISQTSSSDSSLQTQINSLTALVDSLKKQLADAISSEQTATAPLQTQTSAQTPAPQSTAPASCTFNGQSIAHGASVSAYQSSSVAYGSQCAQQTRTCSNGTLSGSYTYPSCTASAPVTTTPTTPPPSGTTTLPGTSSSDIVVSDANSGTAPLTVTFRYLLNRTASCSAGSYRYAFGDEDWAAGDVFQTASWSANTRTQSIQTA